MNVPLAASFASKCHPCQGSPFSKAQCSCTHAQPVEYLCVVQLALTNFETILPFLFFYL